MGRFKMRWLAASVLLMVVATYAIEMGVRPLEIDPIDSYSYQMGAVIASQHSVKRAEVNAEKLATSAVKAEQKEDLKMSGEKAIALQAKVNEMAQKLRDEQKAAAQTKMLEAAATTAAIAGATARKEKSEMVHAQQEVKKAEADIKTNDAKMAAENARLKQELAKEAQEQQKMNAEMSSVKAKDAKIAQLTANKLTDNKHISQLETKVQRLQDENRELAFAAADAKKMSTAPD